MNKPEITYRPLDLARDMGACVRIWRECGWLENPEKDGKTLEVFLSEMQGYVGELRGEAECLATTCPGTIQYLDADLPMSVVSCVTTSRIARKQGMGGRLTAQVVADAASDGAAVSCLGAFEIGYYDKLGFGMGSYEHWVDFDPADLQIQSSDGCPAKCRVPARLTTDDGAAMHRNRLRRLKHHGAVNVDTSGVTRADSSWGGSGFGLGYFDASGEELTHHIWFGGDEQKENGPYRVSWMAYETIDQLRELLAVIKSLDDQVHLIKMFEPVGLQIRSMLRSPVRTMNVRRGADFATSFRLIPWWQARILDVPQCFAACKLRGDIEGVCFNLSVSDPIEKYLPNDTKWRGVGGEYIISLGSESSAELGCDDGLPTIKTNVNSLTRLWLGVESANMLSVSDAFSGPGKLLDAIDRVLTVPQPRLDWAL